MSLLLVAVLSRGSSLIPFRYFSGAQFIAQVAHRCQWFRAQACARLTPSSPCHRLVLLSGFKPLAYTELHSGNGEFGRSLTAQAWRCRPRLWLQNTRVLLVKFIGFKVFLKSPSIFFTFTSDTWLCVARVSQEFTNRLLDINRWFHFTVSSLVWGKYRIIIWWKQTRNQICGYI